MLICDNERYYTPRWSVMNIVHWSLCEGITKSALNNHEARQLVTNNSSSHKLAHFTWLLLTQVKRTEHQWRNYPVLHQKKACWIQVRATDGELNSAQLGGINDETIRRGPSCNRTDWTQRNLTLVGSTQSKTESSVLWRNELRDVAPKRKELYKAKSMTEKSVAERTSAGRAPKGTT